MQLTTTRSLAADEVLIKVTHSGACGSDCHFQSVDMVMGHEGAGVIEVGFTLLLSLSH